ncbi:hypothetical protein BOX15_Mlig020921g1 [Macrostomum lignano]|uniref:cholesterol 7-desaturase n=3 Tax=Macrostomum lignano TaxID=282301 RepID=A0A267GP06_9PLAT|nr:hypothetical protein BOX15_Mlig020921g1 [Macrostomum lignano]
MLPELLHQLVQQTVSGSESLLAPWAWAPALVLLIVLLVYGIFLRKLDYTRSLEDVGYITFDGLSRRDTANRIRRARKEGRVPPVYPNGWYLVMEGDQLKPGEAKSVQMIGKTLAVFRTESGEAHILDAYCPHFGANMGAGGRVVGDCIECPFHGWQFRGSDGRCARIPVLAEGGKIPEMARVTSHIVKEVNGGLYLWFDAEGREPTWDLPVIEEIETGEWSFKGRTRHFVNCHIEEINQNGADVGHLTTVHDPSFFGGTDLRYIFRWWSSFLWQKFSATWKPCTEPGSRHQAVMVLHEKTYLFGKNVKFVEMTVRANQLGPAVVYLEFDSLFGKGVFLHCVTPVEPLLLRVHHSIYMQRWVPNIVATVYLNGEAFQFERDIMIWNNKEFKDKPVLAKSTEDSLMVQHRRWYSQFYSESSPTIESLRDSKDW